MKQKGNSIQSHSLMADRLWSMSYAIRLKAGKNISEEERAAARDLDEKAMYHSRIARVTGEDTFLRVR